MGTSVKMIDATYGHLVADAEAFERDILDAWDARTLAQARAWPTQGSRSLDRHGAFFGSRDPKHLHPDL